MIRSAVSAVPQGEVSGRRIDEHRRERAMLADSRARLRASEGPKFRIPSTAADRVLDELHTPDPHRSKGTTVNADHQNPQPALFSEQHTLTHTTPKPADRAVAPSAGPQHRTAGEIHRALFSDG